VVTQGAITRALPCNERRNPMSGGHGPVIDISGIFIAIAIVVAVVVLIGVWLLVKAVNCIARALAVHPRSKPLWLALILFCLCIGFMVYVWLTQSDQTWYTIAETALGISFISLVITARCVELANSETFERERGSLVQEVLHRPWWNMDDRAREDKLAA
jgi:uncharacterized membrane protein YhaH (DUF805 family)